MVAIERNWGIKLKDGRISDCRLRMAISWRREEERTWDEDREGNVPRSPQKRETLVSRGSCKGTTWGRVSRELSLI